MAEHWRVRCQVKDVARSVPFYTQRPGFEVKHQPLPAFANVSPGGADSPPGGAAGGRQHDVIVKPQGFVGVRPDLPAHRRARRLARKTLAGIRTLIRKADPDIVEEWKWTKAASPGGPV
ncbi:MAG TPA: hypothetical protein VNK41_08820 [Vicinamibacterales bacterium]|nr:hypothetical protein [Vicinamibacterales bacterium]